MVECNEQEGAYGTRTSQQRTYRRDGQAWRPETSGAAKRPGAQRTCQTRGTVTLAPTRSSGSARTGPGDHLPRHTGIKKRQAITPHLIAAYSCLSGISCISPTCVSSTRLIKIIENTTPSCSEIKSLSQIWGSDSRKG